MASGTVSVCATIGRTKLQKIAVRAFAASKGRRHVAIACGRCARRRECVSRTALARVRRFVVLEAGELTSSSLGLWVDNTIDLLAPIRGGRGEQNDQNVRFLRAASAAPPPPAPLVQDPPRALCPPSRNLFVEPWGHTLLPLRQTSSRPPDPSAVGQVKERKVSENRRPPLLWPHV
eukprot:654728-Prorocentrum_minimum.AAC.1